MRTHIISFSLVRAWVADAVALLAASAALLLAALALMLAALAASCVARAFFVIFSQRMTAAVTHFCRASCAAATVAATSSALEPAESARSAARASFDTSRSAPCFHILASVIDALLFAALFGEEALGLERLLSSFGSNFLCSTRSCSCACGPVHALTAYI